MLRVVEAAYAASQDVRTWLQGIADAARAEMDEGLGVVAFAFDARRPAEDWIHAAAVSGADRSFADRIVAAYRTYSPELRALSCFRRGGPRTSSDLFAPGRSLAGFAPLRGLEREVRSQDLFGVPAVNRRGDGCVFGAFLRAPRRTPAAAARRHAVVAAHVASGMRLQQTARWATADAVLDAANRRVVHATSRGAARLDAIREAARRIDDARRERDDARAVDLWPSIVSGAFSVVERFDSDGRRWFVAFENDATKDARALTRREIAIAEHLAKGASNKLIAHAQGITPGAVSAHVDAIRLKVGLQSRAELVELLHAMRTTPATVGPFAGVLGAVCTRPLPQLVSLTAAERSVALLAAHGLDDKSIARSRGSSVRTVANQLASVYRKLGIGSRAELAIRAQDNRPCVARSMRGP
jgi:DNA-binding NarL/FixJ family response regulator